MSDTQAPAGFTDARLCETPLLLWVKSPPLWAESLLPLCPVGGVSASVGGNSIPVGGASAPMGGVSAPMGGDSSCGQGLCPHGRGLCFCGWRVFLWAGPLLLWEESSLPWVESPLPWVECVPSQMTSEEDEHTTSCFCLSKVCIFSRTSVGPASSNCSFPMNIK